MRGPASCSGRSTRCPRQAEPGVETWEGDSWKNRSGTNMWAFFTIDVERGLVVRADRLTDVGLLRRRPQGRRTCTATRSWRSTRTPGKLKWYQQLVHHDLWDYDLPAAPTLVDVKRNGRTIPAVGVITKMSTLFIFDRETGEPIFGMEERPVPQSTVPGEATWPTQPFPLKPEPLGRITFDPETDFNTLTPDVEAYCKELWEKNGMYTKGPFTPPGAEGTMVTFPSTIGGGNWNGLTYDPALRATSFTNIMNLGQVARMVQGTDRGREHDVAAQHAVGRRRSGDSGIPHDEDPVLGAAVRRAGRGRRQQRRDRVEGTPLGFIESLKGEGLRRTRERRTSAAASAPRAG